MKLSAMAKAIVAAVSAAVTAIVVAVQDGAFDTGDGVTTVLAVLGTMGITYAVPNKDGHRL